MRVAVIGAGGWGTALALLLTREGHVVRLWGRSPDFCAQVQQQRENTLYLPGARLPEQLMISASLSQVLEEAEVIVMAVPSHAMRTVAHEVAPLLRSTPFIVSATKGIEEDSLLTMSRVLGEVVSNSSEAIAVLSGPSFAAEVARAYPTAVTVAARHSTTATAIQKVFSSPKFRVYTTTDVTGVEIGGAVKNVIALAAGVSDGLGHGHSARAALITRGLAEIQRLARHLGAESRTLSGLSGIGDLILTCTSNLSRNYRVGMRLAQGEAIAAICQSMTMIAEGVRTSRSVFALARRLGVEMPIVAQVHALLYEGKSAQRSVADLLAREMKPEFPYEEN